MSAERWLRIEYLDGSSEAYSFPEQAKDEYEQTRGLREGLASDRIALEADGILRVIPLSAVKRIEFSPLPLKLPEQVIRGAKLI
jgi:hypothetical protein